MRLRMMLGGVLAALCAMSGGLVGAGDPGLGFAGLAVSMAGLGILHSFLEGRAADGVTVFTEGTTTTDDISYVEEPLPLYVSTKFGFHPVNTSWIARVNGERAMLLEVRDDS